MPAKRLPAHDRELILLHKQAGKTNAELASMFKVTEGGIRYVLSTYKPGDTATRHGGGNEKLTPRCVLYFVWEGV